MGPRRVRIAVHGAFAGLVWGLVLTTALPASPFPVLVAEAGRSRPEVFATDGPASATADEATSAVLPTKSSAPPTVRVSHPFGLPDTSGLTVSGIPVRVQQAYRAAEAATARRDPACRLSWTLLAGIGRVESDHGRYGGSSLRTDGRVTPAILGVRLDGSRAGTARIGDSDGGRFDGDARFDRAVGPMQFLPGTWRGYAAPGADPQDVDDAALTTARYLCAGGGDLGSAAGRWRAVLRYNHSDRYAATVLALASSYASGRTTSFPERPADVTDPAAGTTAASVRVDPPPRAAVKPPPRSAAPTATPTVTRTVAPTPAPSSPGPVLSPSEQPTASPTSPGSCTTAPAPGPSTTPAAASTAAPATAVPTPTAAPTAPPTTEPVSPVPATPGCPDIGTETLEPGRTEPGEAVTGAVPGA